MTHKRLLAGSLALVLALGACSRPGARMFFDGHYYPVKARKGDTREDVTVTVRRADQGLTGARAAGRHEAMRYCIETVGDSTIEWLRGPEAQDGAVVLQGGNLVMQGRCVKW